VIDGAAFDKDVEIAERIVGECLAQGFFYADSGEPVVVAPKPGDPDGEWCLTPPTGSWASGS
jgi:hypothetical protein